MVKLFFVILLYNFYLYSNVNKKNTNEKKNREIENDILNQLNFVRNKPQIYLKEVWIKNKNNFKTGDSKKGYNELVNILKKLKPLPSIRMKLGLRKAAYLHSKWMKEANKFSHTGKNNSKFTKRISEFGKYSGLVGENIFSGFNNGLKIILYFLIDAGIPSRVEKIF